MYKRPNLRYSLSMLICLATVSCGVGGGNKQPPQGNQNKQTANKTTAEKHAEVVENHCTKLNAASADAFASEEAQNSYCKSVVGWALAMTLLLENEDTKARRPKDDAHNAIFDDIPKLFSSSMSPYARFVPKSGYQNPNFTSAYRTFVTNQAKYSFTGADAITKMKQTRHNGRIDVDKEDFYRVRLSAMVGARWDYLTLWQLALDTDKHREAVDRRLPGSDGKPGASYREVAQSIFRPYLQSLRGGGNLDADTQAILAHLDSAAVQGIAVDTLFEGVDERCTIPNAGDPRYCFREVTLPNIFGSNAKALFARTPTVYTIGSEWTDDFSELAASHERVFIKARELINDEVPQVWRNNNTGWGTSKRDRCMPQDTEPGCTWYHPSGVCKLGNETCNQGKLELVEYSYLRISRFYLLPKDKAVLRDGRLFPR